jgi:hypothetical protein
VAVELCGGALGLRHRAELQVLHQARDVTFQRGDIVLSPAMPGSFCSIGSRPWLSGRIDSDGDPESDPTSPVLVRTCVRSGVAAHIASVRAMPAPVRDRRGTDDTAWPAAGSRIGFYSGRTNHGAWPPTALIDRCRQRRMFMVS